MSEPVKQRLAGIEEELELARGRARNLSLIRLAVFIVTGITGFLALRDESLILGAAAGLGVITFGYALLRHGRWLDRVARLELDRDLAREELARREDRRGSRVAPEPVPDALPLDSGSRLYAPEPAAERLDESAEGDFELLEGGRTLFGFLDASSTPFGARRLAHLLTHPLTDPDEIRKRQRAVETLAAGGPALRELVASLARLRTAPVERLPERLREPTPFATRRGLQVLAHLVGTVAAISLGLAFVDARAWSLALPLLIFNFALIGLNSRRARPSRDRIARLVPWLSRIPEVERLTRDMHVAHPGSHREDGDRSPELLAELLEALSAPSRGAHRLLGHARQLELFSLGPITELIHLVTLWELRFLPPAERCLSEHRETIERALAALGELEALVSLALPLLEQEDFTLPEVLDGERPRLEAVELAHPLLPPAGRVANDLSLGGSERLWIITGSNMAGKSTFLKATGSNLALAQAGAPVTARTFRWTPLTLYSDINVRDSLDDGKSYFQVEVERVLRAVLAARRSPRRLVILDELFRGTNSDERLAIARAILRDLSSSGALVVAATHDLGLTRLAIDGEDGFANHHFREEVTDETMTFDYTLRPGPASSRNAIRVLEVSGYPAEIPRAAREGMEKESGES